jgi:hypothetical protein
MKGVLLDFQLRSIMEGILAKVEQAHTPLNLLSCLCFVAYLLACLSLSPTPHLLSLLSLIFLGLYLLCL